MQLERLSTNIEPNLQSSWQLGVKRFFDLMFGLLLLILLSPLLVLLVIIIKIDSPGSPVFTQKRVGKGGELFTIYKFRTMVKNADKMYHKKIEEGKLDNFVYQDKNDFRVTRVGKFLRQTSLDELPQLLNIINGTMSLIGPRPEVPDIAKLYTPEQRRRLLMKPGVTGLAQVNGRGDLNLAETIRYDLQYVNEFSLWLDLKIFFRTFGVVFTGRGAY